MTHIKQSTRSKSYQIRSEISCKYTNRTLDLFLSLSLVYWLFFLSQCAIVIDARTQRNSELYRVTHAICHSTM